MFVIKDIMEHTVKIIKIAEITDHRTETEAVIVRPDFLAITVNIFAVAMEYLLITDVLATTAGQVIIAILNVITKVQSSMANASAQMGIAVSFVIFNHVTDMDRTTMESARVIITRTTLIIPEAIVKSLPSVDLCNRLKLERVTRWILVRVNHLIILYLMVPKNISFRRTITFYLNIILM